MAIIWFLIVLTFLILIHELGHFLVGLWAGVRIQEFGIGLPPKLCTLFSYKGVPFTLNWLPIGGFVRMEGEDGESQLDPSERKSAGHPFYTRSLAQKLAVVFAGPAVNILYAVIIFSALFSIYGIPERTSDAPVLSKVEQGSPAAFAQMQEGDKIVRFVGLSVRTNQELIEKIGQHRGEAVQIVLKRGAQEIETTVTVRTIDQTPAGQGALGVVLAGEYEIVQYPLWQRPFRGTLAGVRQSIDLSKTILSSLGQLVSSVANRTVPKDVSGPVGIAVTVAREGIFSSGIATALHFSALLSLNLAIMNLLPIPALDGGRIVLLLVERAVRQKNFSHLANKLNTIGFLFLLGLMALITLKDVFSLFSHS